MELMDKLFKATQEERVDDVLEILVELEKVQPLVPSLLVLRGMCMQINENEAYSLDEIRGSYEKALEIDPDYIPALIELGHFHYGLEDDAAAALPMFRDALNMCKLQTTEALIGLAACLAEVEGTEKAIELLENADTEVIDQDRLEELREELTDEEK